MQQSLNDPEFQPFLQNKILNPQLNLVCRLWSVISDLTWMGLPPEMAMSDGRLVAECCNASVFALRDFAASRAFKGECAQWQQRASRQLRSAQGFVNALFDRYARVLVIRLDLGYGIGTYQRENLGACRADFKRFQDNQRHNRLFDQVIGMIWRLEFGGQGKGWHYHLALFLDGSRSWSDVIIGDQIGRYWQESITGWTGTYWNCNRNKVAYERLNRLGIGMVHYNDLEKRARLQQAISYLGKMDEYLLELAPWDTGRHRFFGRSTMPHRYSAARPLGRPRLTGLGLVPKL